MAALLDSWSSLSVFADDLEAPGSFAVSSGTDRVLIIQTALRSTSSGSITAVSWGGEAMTLIRRDTIESGSDLDIAWWRLLDADIENASGNAITTTLNAASPSSPNLIVSAATYDDVDQTSPIEDAGFGDEASSGGTPTASAVTTTTDGIAIAALNCNRGTSDAGETEDGSFSNMTERQEAQSTRTYVLIGDAATDGTNFTPAFTITHESNCVLSAFSLADAATAQTVELGLAEETNEAFSITSPLPQNFDGAGLVDVWRTVSSVLNDDESMAVSVATDRLLVAQTHLRSFNAGQITALSYGGQAMTLIRRGQIDLDVSEDGSDLDIAYWYLDDAGIEAATNETFTVTDSGDPELFEFFLNAAVYAGVDQTTPIADNGFSNQAISGANPGTQAVTTDANGVIIASLSANRGTDDSGETEDAVFSNITEKLEVAGDLSYVAIAEADTSGANFSPSGTITHEDAAILIAFSLTGVAPVDEVAVGLASETDTALSITAQRAVTVGQAGELNSALSITPIKGVNVAVGLAEETNEALGIEPVSPGRVQVDQAEETNTAQSINPARAVQVGLAEETNTAQPVTFRREVFVGLAEETNTAQSITFFGQAALAALERRNTAGSAAAIAEGELEARRLGAQRRRIEREDEELIAALPAILQSLLNLEG